MDLNKDPNPSEEQQQNEGAHAAGNSNNQQNAAPAGPAQQPQASPYQSSPAPAAHGEIDNVEPEEDM